MKSNEGLPDLVNRRAALVFSDGDTEELIAVSGDTASGYAGSLTIGVA